MALRRVLVAALAVVAAGLALAGPAGAGTYPPSAPEHQRVVSHGVIYGGQDKGALLVSCSGSRAHTVSEGAFFRIEVCGFVPATDISLDVDPPQAGRTHVGSLVADGNGAVVGGPFALTDPGHYAFYFTGTLGSSSALGVGGLHARGLSRVFADPTTVEVDITVTGAGVMPHTGGDGGAHTALVWGAGLVALGSALVLAVNRRRRAGVAHA